MSDPEFDRAMRAVRGTTERLLTPATDDASHQRTGGTDFEAMLQAIKATGRPPASRGTREGDDPETDPGSDTEEDGRAGRTTTLGPSTAVLTPITVLPSSGGVVSSPEALPRRPVVVPRPVRHPRRRLAVLAVACLAATLAMVGGVLANGPRAAALSPPPLDYDVDVSHLSSAPADDGVRPELLALASAAERQIQAPAEGDTQRIASIAWGPFTAADSPAGSLDPGFARNLPIDPTALQAPLLDHWEWDLTGRTDTEGLLLAVEDLYDNYVLTPCLQSALWRVLARQQGLHDGGVLRDRLGRTVRAVLHRAADGSVTALLLDTRTGSLGGYEVMGPDLQKAGDPRATTVVTLLVAYSARGWDDGPDPVASSAAGNP